MLETLKGQIPVTSKEYLKMIMLILAKIVKMGWLEENEDSRKIV